ncbi:hypothetical protein [Nostoc sp.]|uniref:hypothetical protein n=1 Tax=Nostoc sp. TaxID=1180 RepID=UPI002FF8039D
MLRFAGNDYKYFGLTTYLNATFCIVIVLTDNAIVLTNNAIVSANNAIASNNNAIASNNNVIASNNNAMCVKLEPK